MSMPYNPYQFNTATNSVQPVTAQYADIDEDSQQAFCPRCNSPVITRVEHKNGALTWCLSIGLCLCGCCCGCCLIPFCVDAVKDSEHYCPKCNNLIAVDKKIG